MDIVGQNWRVEYVDVENFGSYHYLLFFFPGLKRFLCIPQLLRINWLANSHHYLEGLLPDIRKVD
jgi:hypothetical protein